MFRLMLIIIMIAVFVVPSAFTQAQTDDMESIVRFSWSNDSQYLAITKNYEWVEIYDVEQSTTIDKITPTSHLAGNTSWNFLDTKIAISGHQGSVEIWNLNKHELEQSIQIDFLFGFNISWSSDEQRLILIGGGDRTPNFFGWDIQKKEIIFEDIISPTSDAEWSHDRQYLAISSSAPHIDLFNVEEFSIEKYVGLTVAEIREERNSNQLDDITSLNVGALSWSPDDQYIVTGAARGQVIVWDVAKNEIVWQVQSNSLDKADPANSQLFRVIDVWYSPNGNYVHSLATNGTYRIWDAINGSLLFEHNIILKTPIHFGHISPDRSALAYKGYEPKFHIVAIDDLIRNEISRKLAECVTEIKIHATLSNLLNDNDTESFSATLEAEYGGTISEACRVELLDMAHLLLEYEID